MTPEQRIQTIQDRLKTAFSPTELAIIDDSHKHIGHAGSQDGAGHYTVKIAADCFNNQSRVTIHREIYSVLSDMIPNEIHALQIHVLAHK